MTFDFYYCFFKKFVVNINGSRYKWCIYIYNFRNLEDNLLHSSITMKYFGLKIMRCKCNKRVEEK